MPLIVYRDCIKSIPPPTAAEKFFDGTSRQRVFVLYGLQCILCGNTFFTPTCVIMYVNDLSNKYETL